MSFPFYQGSVNDLLNVAGQGQGSFILGQLMKAQQDQQKADLEKSIMDKVIRQAEEERKKQMFPLEMQKTQADIGHTQAQTSNLGVQTKKGQFDLAAEEAAGGPQAAGQAKIIERKKRKFETREKMREALADDLVTEEWSPNLIKRLQFLADEYDMPQAYAEQLFGVAQTKESWDKQREFLFKHSMKGREMMLRAEQDRQTRLEVEAQRAQTALRIAEIKAQSARAKATKKDFRNAIVEMMEAEREAMLAGDEARARLYRAEAERFKQQMVEDETIKGQARTQGQPDLSGAGIPTRPPPTAQPIAPAAIPPAGQPQQPPQVQKWGRDPNGNPIRIQ